MGSERKFGWHGLQPNPDVLALPRAADWPPWHQCLSRNGSEAKGRLPGGGRCARPGGGCPIPWLTPGGGSRARPRACAQGCGPLPQGARTAKLDLGGAPGHRPANPRATLSNGPGSACPRAPLSFPPWRIERWAWPCYPRPWRDAAGCEGPGETRSLRPQAPAGGGKPVLARRGCTRAGSDPA